MASKKSDQYPIDFTEEEVLAGLAWQIKNGRCELEGDSLDRHSVRLMAWECRQGRRGKLQKEGGLMVTDKKRFYNRVRRTCLEVMTSTSSSMVRLRTIVQCSCSRMASCSWAITRTEADRLI